ncbi:MAG TPA: NAD(P)/FAD-dependent oxidoreductase [Flavisolibacter sp.]|nr:NAD(P)/FAD-dependent oxidoreductase [Flavisolibacter sp.]
MHTQNHYDTAIAGGGLAGLAAAIRLAELGYRVVLFEKENYPFHKVCGEYISLESWPFLESLGLPLKEMNLPLIDTLLLTAPNGKSFRAQLPLGGFGLSRYRLDEQLAGIAAEKGVEVVTGAKVDDIGFDEGFRLSVSSIEGKKEITATTCLIAHGKRGLLDLKLNREFLDHQDKRLDNHVAVKYHIKTRWPDNVIGLHNFSDGYCGISRIEEDRYCLCYLTRAANLRKGGSIAGMEKNILHKNPRLREIFERSEVCSTFPITISQVGFGKKTQVENHALMLGDAAGMITPLCGNGMSIALHTGKLAADLSAGFLSGKMSRVQMETKYAQSWKHHFHKRLRTGRVLQRFFGSPLLSNVFVQGFSTLPFLAKPVIRMTHGEAF